MYGSDVTNHVRHSRLMNEFDKFVAKEGESLEYVYERLTTLVNIMDRNNVHLIRVSINTKFLNCLKPEWSKYVVMVYHNQTGDTDGRVDIQIKNTRYGGNGNRNAGRQNKNQVFNAGNGLTQNDERRNLKDKENDFMLDNFYGDETLKELTTIVITMARIQPADDNVMTEPNYDAKAISAVNASHKMIPKGVYEHKNHGKRKTIVNTYDDDQIDSNIIFVDPYVENNVGSYEHDSNAHTCKEWVKPF
ncbi:hypothetical protein Tco_1439430 [Tanacetum coccineum]